MEWLKLRERSFTEWSRWFVMLAVGLTVGVVSYTFVAATPVAAVDGEWDNQAIVYGGESYQPVRDTGEMARKLGLPQGTRIYAIESQAGNTTTVKAIYFTPGTDIGQANSAQTATFTINGTGPAEKKDEKQISLTPAGESIDKITGECGVENIGWVVCPVTNSLAAAMDTIYSGLMRFLDARHLNISDRDSGIYIAWSIMLSFANVAFIAGFLVLIYSYLTSTGVSNYGIKRMLPRLMVAAILVNLSFYICAIAIDLSNISGRAIQDMFIEIRNTVANTAAGGTSDQGATWSEVAAVVLIGGTGAGAGAVWAISNLPWFVPALLAAGLALIVVVIVLAARQALIVILTIISPLAFVAYIFPGTEKWFEKWRDLFFTMLIFFPAFSAVFGGAQLAGLAIVQNADSIIMTILGLTVQVAPLAIAPLIMKLSGGLLNRLAGVINNPQRGLIDKSKQWAAKKSEQRFNNKLYGEKGKKELKGREVSKRFARWMQRQNTLLDEDLERSREASHIGRRDHGKYRAFDKKRHLTEMSKQTLDKDLEHSRNHYVRTTSDGTNAHLRLRAMTDQADESAKRLDAQYEDFRTGKDRVYTGEMARLQQSAMQTQESAFLTDQRISMAKAEQSQRIADRMTANTAQVLDNNSRLVSYLDYAGGVSGSSGATAALANAIAARNKAHVEGVQEAAAIQNHFKLTGEQRSSLINGNDVQITNESGQVVYTFKSTDRAAVEAASAEQFRIGTYAQKLEVALQTNHAVLNPATGSVQAGLTHDIRSAVSDAAAANGIAKTAVFLGGKTIEDMKTGTMTIEQAIVQTIAGGKVKDIDLSSNDADALRAMFEFDQRLVPADKLADFQAGIQALRESAWRILKSPELSANGSASSKRVLKQYAVRPPKDI